MAFNFAHRRDTLASVICGRDVFPTGGAQIRL
jgi:hypothetical protein